MYDKCNIQVKRVAPTTISIGDLMVQRWVKTWDEEDAYTSWRGAYNWKPGVLHWIKRSTHKRERREAKTEIRDYKVEW